jgi:vacuolar-type H+-ATPase subunit I/STV1
MQRIPSLDKLGKESSVTVSLLEVYRLFLHKEKALYSTLNKFKKEEKLYLGFCWIPKSDNQEVLHKIEALKDSNRNIEIPTLKVVQEHSVRPPSLFRLNEVTWVF